MKLLSEECLRPNHTHTHTILLNARTQGFDAKMYLVLYACVYIK